MHLARIHSIDLIRAGTDLERIILVSVDGQLMKISEAYLMRAGYKKFVSIDNTFPVFVGQLVCKLRSTGIGC